MKINHKTFVLTSVVFCFVLLGVVIRFFSGHSVSNESDTFSASSFSQANNSMVGDQEVATPNHPSGKAIEMHDHSAHGDSHDHHHHHDVLAIDLDSLMADSWKVREHWYDEPMMLNQESYIPKNIPLQLDEHCLTNETLNPEATFSGHIASHYGQDVSERDASGTFFKSITQFFAWEDRYWQINLIWDFDMPPVYRHEFFSSDVKGFDKNVEGVQTPIEFPKYADAISAQEWLDQVVAHYESQSAEIGARIVEQRVMDREGKAHEWTSLNGQLTTWQFGSGVCVLDSSGTSGRCACERDNQKT